MYEAARRGLSSSSCRDPTAVRHGIQRILLYTRYPISETPFYARGSCMQSVKFRSVISPLLFHARARGRRVGQLEAPAGKFERSSQARFGGLTLVSRAPWLLVTGAPGLFSWPNTLWNTAVACRMSPTSRTGQAAASRRHRHRNSRGAAAARPWATHAGMDAT